MFTTDDILFSSIILIIIPSIFIINTSFILIQILFLIFYSTITTNITQPAIHQNLFYYTVWRVLATNNTSNNNNYDELERQQILSKKKTFQSFSLLDRKLYMSKWETKTGERKREENFHI